MPRRVDRASRLVAQVTTAMINNLQQARIEAARAAGQRMLHIELDIDRRIGLWDTAAMPRIFEIGSARRDRSSPGDPAVARRAAATRRSMPRCRSEEPMKIDAH